MSTSGGSLSGGGTDASALAYTAHEYFQKQEYATALEYLEELLAQKQSSSEELSIQHNIAVTKYYQQGCRNPETLLDSLQKLNDSVLAQAEKEASRSTAGQSTEAKAKAHAARSSVAHVLYNQALVYIQLRRWSRAASLLSHLFGQLDQLQTTFAISVCFLCLQLHLACQNVDQALRVIDLVEQQLLEHTQADEELELDDDGKPTYAQQVSSAPGEPPVWTTARVQALLHVYRAMALLQKGTVKQTRRELKSALSVRSQSPTAMFVKANLEYLRFNHRKAIKVLAQSFQLHNLANEEEAGSVDLGGTSRLDNELLNLVIPAYYFNNLGCLEFQQGKFSAAAAYFAKAFAENDHVYSSRIMPSAGQSKSLPSFAKDRKPQILYNCGLQLLLTGKPESAFRCFMQASCEYYSHPLLWLRTAECCVAAYTVSICDALRGHQSDLVLAVHPAENNKSHIRLNTNYHVPSDLFLKRDLLATHTRSTEGNGWSEDLLELSKELPTPTLRFAVKCLHNAEALLLKRGLFWRKGNSGNSGSSSSSNSNNGGGGDNGNGDEEAGNGNGHNSVAATLQVRSLSGGAANSVEDLQMKVQLNLAFVWLCLDSPLEAYAAADKAIQLLNVLGTRHQTLKSEEDEVLPSVHAGKAKMGADGEEGGDQAGRSEEGGLKASLLTKWQQRQHMLRQNLFQANMYAAEALFKMDRLSEALVHLTPSKMLSEEAITASQQVKYYQVPFLDERYIEPGSEQSRAALFVNLACVCIAQGDFHGALKAVTSAHLAWPQSTHARLLMVYLEMKAGNKQSALEVLKRR